MNNLRKLIDEWVDERHPDQEILIADGFDGAFIGIALQFNQPIAIYNRQKCIDILATDMSHVEAEEYFEFNVQGAYVGPNTPAFLEVFDPQETKN